MNYVGKEDDYVDLEKTRLVITPTGKEPSSLGQQQAISSAKKLQEPGLRILQLLTPEKAK